MKQKLLIISSFVPFPLVQGGSIAQYYFLEKLSAEFDIFFNPIVYSRAAEEAVKELTKALPAIKVIPFTYFVKESGPLEKLIQVARLFLNFLRKLMQTNKQKEINKEKIAETDDFNVIYPVELYSKEYIQFVTGIIKKEEIKIVQLEFYDTLSLLKALPKHVKKIAVTHEIRSKRLLLAAKNSKASEDYKEYLINCSKLIEDNFLKNADQIIVFNEDDKNLLLQINQHVAVSPYGIPAELIIRNKVSDVFDHFLFIGGQRHDPNRAGLEWFLEEIYIANYDDIKLPIYVIGQWDDYFREKYKKYSKIVFTGIVEDLSSSYKNAIMVTPILSGSGLRTKILHAFVNKIPVMTTTFASEGLLNDVQANPHLILFDNATSFMSELKAFLNKPEKLQLLAQEGFNYYQKNFAENTLVSKRVEALLS